MPESAPEALRVVGAEFLRSFKVIPTDTMLEHEKHYFPLFYVQKNDSQFLFDRLLHLEPSKKGEGHSVAMYKSDTEQVVVKAVLNPGFEDVEMVKIVNLLAIDDLKIVDAIVAYEGEPFERTARRTRPRPNNFCVILMNYVGKTLSLKFPPAHEAEMRLRLNLCLEIARECQKLLQFNLIYADLKTSNIAIDEHGQCILLDYGSIYIVGSRSACSTFPPPENPRGTNILASERLVVYDIGVLLAFCLHGDLVNKFRYLTDTTEEFASLSIQSAINWTIENTVDINIKKILNYALNNKDANIASFIDQLKNVN